MTANQTLEAQAEAADRASAEAASTAARLRRELAAKERRERLEAEGLIWADDLVNKPVFPARDAARQAWRQFVDAVRSDWASVPDAYRRYTAARHDANDEADRLGEARNLIHDFDGKPKTTMALDYFKPRHPFPGEPYWKGFSASIDDAFEEITRA